MKTFVIGDIHGAFKALLQCLQRSGFNYQNDRLIALGDVCDRGDQVKECIDELLKIKNCIYLLGNHDFWVLEWAINCQSSKCWLGQGGEETISSYKGEMLKEHIQFLAQAPIYFEEDNKLFVHGGFNPDEPIDQQDKDELMWDRNLLDEAWKKHLLGIDYKFGIYDEIFVGHTPTKNFKSTKPLKLCNVWALDTGAGWGESLTIMDVDTKEYWQSDLTRFIPWG